MSRIFTSSRPLRREGCSCLSISCSQAWPCCVFVRPLPCHFRDSCFSTTDLAFAVRTSDYLVSPAPNDHFDWSERTERPVGKVKARSVLTCVGSSSMVVAKLQDLLDRSSESCLSSNGLMDPAGCLGSAQRRVECLFCQTFELMARSNMMKLW